MNENGIVSYLIKLHSNEGRKVVLFLEQLGSH